MDDALNKALEHERETLETRRLELEKEIAHLEVEREAVSFKLGHIIALLRRTETEEAKEVRNIPAEVTEASDDSRDPVELAHAILEERGTEPIYYRELADLIKERGGELEGKDPAITLVSSLVADERFVRPFRRGWYALRVHYPKVKSVGARKKRKIRRAVRG